MMRGVINGPGSDLGLINRRHRLRLVPKPAFNPSKLRRIQRRHLNHHSVYIAAVMKKLCAQRSVEAQDGMLGRAVRRL
jgi:hypothetical protein